jgi:CHASE2 domain-containing sensor protein
VTGLRDASRLVSLVGVVAAGYLAGATLAGDGVDWVGLLAVVVGTGAVLALLWRFRAEFAAESE